MSHTVDIYCRTCKESLGLDLHSGYQDKLIGFVKLADKLAEAGANLRLVSRYDYSLTVEIDDVQLSLSWFIEHEDHDIAVRDEYGRFIDECGEFFNCPNCSTRHICRLEPGHDGHHSPKIASIKTSV